MAEYRQAGRAVEGRLIVKYAVVFEKSEENYAAYVPDLPGCIATGATREEVEKNIREAILFHIEGMRLDGESVPHPQSWAELVDV